MFKRTFMKNMKLINEEINKIRKMMGLNEGWDNDDYVDDISSAKSSAKRQYDFYQDAIEYVGGEEEWNKLTQDEKDSVINDMERDFDHSRSLGENLGGRVVPENIATISDLRAYAKENSERKIYKTNDKFILNDNDEQIEYHYKKIDNEIIKYIGQEEVDEWPLDESNDNIINPNYTHFAILNSNNKIASGWEYASDLDRSDIIYYVKFDMDDMDYKPSEYKIRTAESLKNNGIDPFNPENWDKYNN
jgi:hypothetical protein